MLKAILFDLDHTLIDWDAAEPWQDHQIRRLGMLRDYVHHTVHPLPEAADALAFFTAFTEEQHQAWEASNHTLRAPDVRKMLAKVLQRYDVPVDRIDLDTLVRAYDWGPIQGERLFSDVLEVLPELRAHGLALGIVTNADQPMIYRDRELHAMEIIDYFPHCRVAAVDFGVLKPHPSIFDYALDLVGVEANEAVFVGDNLLADIKGAQSAGLYGVWRRGPNAENQLAEYGDNIVPDGTIDTLHDLPPLLDRWFPGWRNGSSS